MAAGATARGELVGWVDLPDALEPRCLLRCGAQLDSVLWVRPPRRPVTAVRAAELLLQTGLGLVVLDLDDSVPGQSGLRPELERLGASIWLRLARAARVRRSTLLLLTNESRAGAQATLGLRTERAGARFESGLLEGLDARLRVTRSLAPSVDAGSGFFRLHHRP
jgi:hypothetical protein